LVLSQSTYGVLSYVFCYGSPFFFFFFFFFFSV
jgi:hypothetical protein